MDGEEFEDIDEFRYLGAKVTKDGSGKTEVEIRVIQGRIGGALRALVNGNNFSVECTKILNDGVLL